MDFGIVHDCFTITELLTYQDLGLCQPGEAADLIRDGITSIEGDFPINPDGGLKCFGHPVGATGAMRMTTLVHEMRRRNAKYGLETICGGGGLGIAIIVERK